MSEIDVSKIPADVMQTAKDLADDGRPDQAIRIAIAILTERAACAQHAFAMRWAPPAHMNGTKEADNIARLTASWSNQIGMGILNR